MKSLLKKMIGSMLILAAVCLLMYSVIYYAVFFVTHIFTELLDAVFS